MDERVVFVTGANRGLGRAVAEAVARRRTVVLLCRDRARAAEAVEQIRTATGNAAVHSVMCNLTRPASVREAVREVCARFGAVDTIVANAGLTVLERTRTPLGVELGWHAGFLGHVQLVEGLIPHLGPAARLVFLAGISHRSGELALDDLDWSKRPWSWQQAAADVQLARVIYATDLARRLPDATVYAVHPGAVRTGAQDVLPWGIRLLIDTVMRPGFSTPRRAAQHVVRLLDPDPTAPSGTFFRRSKPCPLPGLAVDRAAATALREVTGRLLSQA